MNLTLFEKQQWLEVSRSCDWMCLGCPLVSSVTQALHIQKTVDKLKSSGYVNIYGGNPFMYVHFLKLKRGVFDFHPKLTFFRLNLKFLYCNPRAYSCTLFGTIIFSGPDLAQTHLAELPKYIYK